MTNVARVCLVGFLCLSAADGWAYTPPAGSPLARREHPRLFLTQAGLPAMRAKLAGPFRDLYQSFVTHLDSVIGQPATTTTTS